MYYAELKMRFEIKIPYELQSTVPHTND